MTHAEAVRIVAALAAMFRQEVSEETAVLWAREIAQYQTTDALEAVEIAGNSGKFMPSLAEFTELTRDCRNVRLRRETPALPTPHNAAFYPLAQFLHDNPDMAERVKKLSINVAHLKPSDDCIPQTFARILEGEMGQ